MGCDLIEQGIVPVLADAYGCNADAVCSRPSGRGYATCLVAVGLTVGEEDHVTGDLLAVVLSYFRQSSL